MNATPNVAADPRGGPSPHPALASALLLAVVIIHSGCASEEPVVRPAPLAGMQHVEIVKVGQPVVLDGRLSVVAGLAGDDGPAPAPGARLVRYRFAVADGTAAVDQASATLSHVFATAGVYAVSLTISDDRGKESSVSSLVHAQPDFSPTCTADSPGPCLSGVCGGGACVVMACAAQDVCDAVGEGLTCKGSRCELDPASP